MFENLLFPKVFRLRKKYQFQATLSARQSLLGKYFVLYYTTGAPPEGRSPFPRLGIIVSKTKCPLAVRRNRIKRQARESFRLHRLKLPGYDMVVVARQTAKEADQNELRQCLDELFIQLATLGEKS